METKMKHFRIKDRNRLFILMRKAKRICLKETGSNSVDFDDSMDRFLTKEENTEYYSLFCRYQAQATC